MENKSIKSPKEKSPLQKMWEERVRILWRIKGFYINPETKVLTDEERTKIKAAISLLQSVVKKFDSNSETLGFKTKLKCKFCGKILSKKELVTICKECGEIYENN